jgi:hypothetical protein
MQRVRAGMDAERKQREMPAKYDTTPFMVLAFHLPPPTLLF